MPDGRFASREVCRLPLMVGSLIIIFMRIKTIPARSSFFLFAIFSTAILTAQTEGVQRLDQLGDVFRAATKAAEPSIVHIESTRIRPVSPSKSSERGVQMQIEETGSGVIAELGGKRVIVTGGASGFGEGLARGFAGRGASVALADINGQGAREKAVAIARDSGARVIGLEVDVGSEASVRQMVDDAVSELGGLDIMISCAGILIAGNLATTKK